MSASTALHGSAAEKYVEGRERGACSARAEVVHADPVRDRSAPGRRYSRSSSRRLYDSGKGVNFLTGLDKASPGGGARGSQAHIAAEQVEQRMTWGDRNTLTPAKSQARTF